MSKPNIYMTDNEELIIPDAVYDRAVELSGDGDLKDEETEGFKYLAVWAETHGKK